MTVDDFLDQERRGALSRDMIGSEAEGNAGAQAEHPRDAAVRGILLSEIVALRDEHKQWLETAEYNPIETIKTNVLGVQNVIEAAIYCGVRKVLSLSTDKAVSPFNLYGATKLCAEKLFVSANSIVGIKKITFSKSA